MKGKMKHINNPYFLRDHFDMSNFVLNEIMKQT